jgi:hypothetical protein
MRVTRIAALLALTLATVGALAATPSAGYAQPAAPHTCYPVSGHFINRWNQSPSTYGCATSPEYPYLNGAYQEFEHGEMDWSPSQGGNMVVAGIITHYWDDWGYHTGIMFQFGQSDPFNYDSWLIRIKYNGVNLGDQIECWAGWGCTRTSGIWNWGSLSPGHYQIITEGCDVNAGGHTCNQQWTIPVDLYL